VPWLPGVVREDTAFQKQIDDMTDGALAQARADLPATFTTVKARSTPTGLLDAAQQHDASLIVVGSSAAGLFGRISLSSVADRLLHSSHVPVALAPRAFRSSHTAKVDCVTVAYTGTNNAIRC
jgi:nucleotide-binding universal stress UspA family protein